MHPDDELKKRLRERFASYEPEPEISWQQLEERLFIPPQPFRRKRRRVVAIVLVFLLVTSIGFWISRPFRSSNLETSSKAKGTVSKPLLPQSDISKRVAEKQVRINHRRKTNAVSALQRPVDTSAEAKPSPGTSIYPMAQLIEAKQLSNRNNRIRSGFTTPMPILDQRPTSHKSGIGLLSGPVTKDAINSLFPEQDPVKSKSSQSMDSSLLFADLPNEIQSLKTRLIAHPSVDLLPTHLSIQPAIKEYVTSEPTHTQRAWIVKGGPFLGYSVMNSKLKADNSAQNLENLRTSLSQRLGWHLYIGRQHWLSHGRQLEIGAVLRHFGQGIQYQVPNGAYSVVVQPDRSLLITQLRDTLSDQSNPIQAGLRLGYRTPILHFSGLHWGVGGEAVYQFDLRHTVVNAEVIFGKTLRGTRSATFLIELFVNTAIKPVYDSNTWVRVVPYRVGLRIGMPLPISQ